MAHNLQVEGKVRKGKAGEWNVFTITPKADLDNALGNVVVSIDGPSKPQLEFEYESQKVIVKYWPEFPGIYKIEIAKGGNDIEGSPIRCVIAPANDAQPDLIKVYGDGLTKAQQSKGNLVTVDVTKAHIVGTSLKAYMQGKTFPMRKYGKPDVYVSEDKPGEHTVKFVPKFAGTYKLFLEFDKIKVPGSPYAINVEDPASPNQVENWPVRQKPKKVLFNPPRAQQVAIVVTPCQ